MFYEVHGNTYALGSSCMLEANGKLIIYSGSIQGVHNMAAGNLAGNLREIIMHGNLRENEKCIHVSVFWSHEYF